MGSTELKPRGPSDFLREVREIIEASAATGAPCGEVDQWSPDPADGEQNPLRDNVIEGVWPAAAAAGPPSALHRGAGLVAAAGAALTAEPQTVAGPDPHGWAAEVDALLAEAAGATAS